MTSPAQPVPLALIGHGKMGRLIEQQAGSSGFAIQLVCDSRNNSGGQALTAEALRGVAVAIEFTRPDAAVGNLIRLAQLRIPTVTGTTGWDEHREQVEEAVRRAGSALVWSPNFSIGMAVFSRLVTLAAELLTSQPEYGAWAWEIHHQQKKDSLSGTLVQLVERMRKAGFDRDISVSSNRAGAVPGTHEIGFDCRADTITLRHAARSRDAFAAGALQAARWILGRSGVFTFEDVLFAPRQPS